MSSGRGSSGKMSLMEIQAEQERERARSSSSNNNNNNNNSGRRSGGGGGGGGGSSHRRGSYSGSSGGGGGSYHHRSSSAGGGGGGGRRGSNHSRRGSDRSSLPLERGCICSLKDKFGFIHCADRPVELFFHYSEVTNVHPDDLQMDDEVEFRIGKSRDNPDKLAALEVCRLPTGTVQWEYEESPGERFQGLIDRPLMRSGSNNNIMNNSRRSNSSDNDANVEGLIRLLVPAEEVKDKEGESGADASENNKNNKTTDDKNNNTSSENNGDDAPDAILAADGPKIRFTANDYIAESTTTNGEEEEAVGGGGGGGGSLQRKNSSSSTASSSNRLYRGDLVEFTLVVEKRTRQKFARNVVLLQSERERARLAKEKEMLANATLERGMVIALKQDFGFLRSNARRDYVYFHYSQVELPENEKNGDQENDDEHELQVGQEMEFLVVNEQTEDRNNNNNNRKNNFKARKVKFLPKGTVQFEKVCAEGVTGVMMIVPRADAGQNSQREQDPQSMGSIRLRSPITTTNPKTNETETVSTVLLHVSDSPGGIFTCSRGSSLGLWIREGDTLLFDVLYDFVDGNYHARPTKHLVPAGSPISDSLSTAFRCGEEKENATTSNGTEGEGEKGVANDDTPDGASVGSNNNKSKNQKQRGGNVPGPAVRLIRLCLAGRAEGIVHTIKEAYGFVHFAERPVDVHFKNFELLPDDVQEDLRRNMGLFMEQTTKADMMGLHKLSVGTEVQFDLSVQGTVMTQNQHPHRGANKRAGAGAQANQHERENLKGQRLLILPRGTIMQNKTAGLGIKGVITKEDPNQPYAGTLELEKELPQMTLEERHPLVVEMVDEFLQDEGAETLVFHDIQSPKEEDVISDILEIKGPDRLTFTHIPQAGDPHYAGRLVIRKVSKEEAAASAKREMDASKMDTSMKDESKKDGAETTDGKDEKKQDAEKEDPAAISQNRSKSPRGGRSKSPKGRVSKKKKALELKLKPIGTIRFDKSSLTQHAKTDVPPGTGDVIICDVHQIRRTGKVHLENLSVVERKVIDASELATLEGATGVGVVKEVVLASKFGFISVADEAASKRELLFFHFASVVDPHHGHQQHQHNNHGRNKKGGTGAADAVIHKGDEVKFKIGTEKNGKRVAVEVQIISSGTIPNNVEKNACRGYILVEPTDTKVGSPVKPSRSFNRSRDPPTPHNSGGRWDNVKDDHHKDNLSSKSEGVILLLEDPSNMFAAAVEKSQKEHGMVGDGGSGKCHLHYQNGAIALHGAGAPTTMDSSTNPRRGDLVTFVKAKSNNQGVRDIRVVTRAAATLVRGRLESIDHLKRTAKFVGSVGGDQKEFEISLTEVVSCDPSQLKNRVEVEGILQGDAIHGVCRTTDLRLETKLGTGRKERPKLNLTVKKDRAGTIMAQSMMAKGPDGTTGFAPGWTKRVSKYSSA